MAKSRRIEGGHPTFAKNPLSSFINLASRGFSS
jgi:hypothetical protein